MGAALGMILGAGGAYLGAQARQQRALEFQQKEEFHQGFDQFLNSNPAAAANPEVQKIGKQVYGKLWEPKMQILGFAAQAKQKEEQQFQQMLPGGAAPAAAGGGSPTNPMMPTPAGGTAPTAAPAAAPQSQPVRMPQTLDEWTDFHNKLVMGRSHFTDPNHVKAIEDYIKVAEEAINRLRGDQIEQEKEKREPKLAAEKRTAEIGAETSPSAIAAESRLHGAESGASASARERVELSPSVTAGKVAQETQIEKGKKSVKAEAPGKPGAESAERARRTQTVERLNKEYDSLHPIARLTTGNYEKNRDQYVAQRLGGVSPVDYINQSATAAAGVSSDVSSYADKYFPKKK